ncbi:MAG: hypothetical protein LC768_06240 [Acidobacteria bacterium]|nr:hypothetical protein [Acidobacteriota bacterium]MCA1637924.1 hypothetical protein [Acidobacteriota bacterium]
MFDTVAISRTFIHKPNFDLLENNGCKLFFSKYTGEPYKLVLNDNKDAKQPRLTISESPKAFWIIKAEVSIPDWLHGSNLFLPDENDLKVFFKRLSQFVGDNTGIKFNATSERVTRVDITRDLQSGENKVLSQITTINQIRLAKYDWQPFNDTGVYYVNKGKKKNKRYLVYSKYHDFADKNRIAFELELAKGLLRLEIQHKDNTAVSNLAKSLKYPNHNANYILTRETSEKVIEKAMKLFHLEPSLGSQNSPIENLFNCYDSLMAYRLTGHLYLKSIYGVNYSELPFIKVSEKTVKNYEKECVKTGVLSLE